MNITKEDYVAFKVEDYVDNPVALARIKARLTQKKLAHLLKVSQAYISKIEHQENVSIKVIEKLHKVLDKYKKLSRSHRK